MNRKKLAEYTQSVHKAVWGTPLPCDPHHNASDHPYEGYDLEVMKGLVDNDLIKKQVRSFEKDLMAEVEVQYADLAINTPVKITKGSSDKRGTEGFIIFAKDPLQGSGKALVVFEVETYSTCYVRSSATKPRLPKPGERDKLNFLYQEGQRLAPSFKKDVQVKLKTNFLQRGRLYQDASLDSNLEGAGFYQAMVIWSDGSRSLNLLTELEII